MIQPPKAETKKILLRAAEILEGGWCRGVYARSQHTTQVSIMMAQPGVDRFCLTGAIMKAVMEYLGNPPAMHSGQAGVHPLTTAAFNAMHDTGLHVGSLTHWNDRVCPSGEVAVAAVRRAADGLGD